MPRLPLTPEEFRKRKEAYRTASEQALRDLQARQGEPATCPASNAFFKAQLAGRRFRRALDLGCHTGIFAAEVLAPVAEALTLADYSKKALEAALVRLPRAQGVQADLAREWPKVEALGRFDLVSLCEVIQHMPEAADREAVFRGAAGLLEPGGAFLFSTYFLKEGEPADGFFHSDRHDHLLFYHRSGEEENAQRFREAGLEVQARMREARVDAFVLRRAAAILPLHP